MKMPRLALACLCAVVPSSAYQTAAVDPIPWSASRKLDWRDFRAKAPGELQGARSMLKYSYSIGCRDDQLHADVTTLFLPDQSWVAYRVVSSGLASPLGLRHEQTHFDLKEVYTRRVRKMFGELASPCPRSDNELFAMAERVFQQEAAAQRLFEDETQAGTIEARQLDWEKRISADLESLSAFAAPAGVQTIEVQPFMVAVAGLVGERGIPVLLPIARFTGSNWINTWVTTDEYGKPFPPLEKIPAAWLGGAVPREWTVWLRRGLTTKARVIGTIRRDGCSSPVELTVEPLSVTSRYVLEAGRRVAVTSDQAVEDVRELKPGEPEFARVRPLIEEAFRANEAGTIRSESRRAWVREALAQLDVTKRPFEIESVWRQASDASPVVYCFEARKEGSYRDGLTLTLKIAGWIRLDASGQSTTVSVSGSVYEEEGMWHRLPIGLLRVGSRTLWVMGLAHYESGEFEIREVTTTAVRRLTTADNGGC